MDESAQSAGAFLSHHLPRKRASTETLGSSLGLLLLWGFCSLPRNQLLFCWRSGGVGPPAPCTRKVGLDTQRLSVHPWEQQRPSAACSPAWRHPVLTEG